MYYADNLFPLFFKFAPKMSDPPNEKTSAGTPSSRLSTGNLIEERAAQLISAIKVQFQLSTEMAAVDLETTAAMNDSTRSFYTALQERFSTLLTSTQQAQKHADAARPLAEDMTALLQRVKHLEALIDRLDEYTAKQEAALTKGSS